ncbi:ATP-binding protein [uncultured Paracoccus sp.]|uniref:ATP-binding protein n=1 Tax=uncultured Paracoccus sp. TaxID=189685 RepID=UPI002623B22F|nr:ATP-binding protein [uncultured Paracoccus sp.]
MTTAKRSVREGGSIFGDLVVETAILDRLLHHSQIITIRRDSYGLRGKRWSDLLQKVGLLAATWVQEQSRSVGMDCNIKAQAAE